MQTAQDAKKILIFTQLALITSNKVEKQIKSQNSKQRNSHTRKKKSVLKVYVAFFVGVCSTNSQTTAIQVKTHKNMSNVILHPIYE